VSYARRAYSENERGEKAMGFLKLPATHSFLTERGKGGVIKSRLKTPPMLPIETKSGCTWDTSQKHFKRRFRHSVDLCVHDTVPPGVPEMKRLRKNIQYAFEENSGCGDALLFPLRTKKPLKPSIDSCASQIEEHKTGDPLDVR